MITMNSLQLLTFERAATYVLIRCQPGKHTGHHTAAPCPSDGLKSVGQHFGSAFKVCHCKSGSVNSSYYVCFFLRAGMGHNHDVPMEGYRFRYVGASGPGDRSLAIAWHASTISVKMCGTSVPPELKMLEPS